MYIKLDAQFSCTFFTFPYSQCDFCTSEICPNCQERRINGDARFASFVSSSCVPHDAVATSVEGDYIASLTKLFLLQVRAHTKTTRQEMEGLHPFWLSQDTAPHPSRMVSLFCLSVCPFANQAESSSPIRKIDGRYDRTRVRTVNTCKKMGMNLNGRLIKCEATMFWAFLGGKSMSRAFVLLARRKRKNLL